MLTVELSAPHPVGSTAVETLAQPIWIHTAVASVHLPAGQIVRVVSIRLTRIRMEATSVLHTVGQIARVITTQPIPIPTEILLVHPRRRPILGVRHQPQPETPTAGPSAPAHPTTGDGKKK